MYVAISKLFGSTQGKHLIVHRFLNWYDSDGLFPTDKRGLNDKHGKVQQIYKNKRKIGFKVDIFANFNTYSGWQASVAFNYLCLLNIFIQYYFETNFMSINITFHSYTNIQIHWNSCVYFYFVLYLDFINFSSDWKTTGFVKLHLCNIWCNTLWNIKLKVSYIRLNMLILFITSNRLWLRYEKVQNVRFESWD